MSTQAYPGIGLSLSQLVFALNQKLKRAPHSPVLTFDKFSQLDLDISTALVKIREWRNSFIHINRIPLDILSLIATHLSSQKDRIRASSVCRHWRRSFLHRAELWSRLFLSNGEVYVKTFLERAKGSALDIVVGRELPVNTIALLSPNIGQIRSLNLLCDEGNIMQRFLQANSGPFPFLQALTIHTDDTGRFNPITPLTEPYSINAVNLRVLHLYSKSRSSPSFAHFHFPNLISFKLSAEGVNAFRASHLLDFFEASPMLQTVSITIIGSISFEDAPREEIVILPDVRTFELTTSDTGTEYKIAAHISCPSARSTSLAHKHVTYYTVPANMFPTSSWLNMIVCQYTTTPVEEVTIRLETDLGIIAQLTFRSADGALIKLRFNRLDVGLYPTSSLELQKTFFTQLTRAVQCHPHLANVRCLRICHGFHFICSPEDSYIASELGRLFRSVGPLDELTIYRCNLRPYCYPLFSLQGDHTEGPVVFPPIKKLTILHPVHQSEEQFEVAMVGMAKSQHGLGVPFEHVVIRGTSMPTGMEEGLRPWVSSVVYIYDEVCELDDD